MQDFIARYSYPHLEMPGVVVVDSDNGRFMNHSLTPNTDFRIFDKGYALVDIAQGDEITCNYHEFDPTFAGFFPACAGGHVGGQAACRPLIAAPARAGRMSRSGRAAGGSRRRAEPGFAWMVSPYEGNVSLIYGSTETGEDYSFFLSCDNQQNEAEMTVYQDIAGAKVGEPVTIEISAGSAEVALKGETATDEMSGFVFGVAKKIAVKPVVAVLESAGSGDRQNG